MRLNKSFVVERSVTGNKAVYQALRRTSAYVRGSLEEGVSVWIAQREGRSKDGLDRTAPALIKMLALAHDEEMANPGDLCERVPIVPVAITYEIDPCAPRKARELYITHREGCYDKPEGEDLASIVEGMLGFKGAYTCISANGWKAIWPMPKPWPARSTGASSAGSRCSRPTFRQHGRWDSTSCPRGNPKMRASKRCLPSRSRTVRRRTGRFFSISTPISCATSSGWGNGSNRGLRGRAAQTRMSSATDFMSANSAIPA